MLTRIFLYIFKKHIMDYYISKKSIETFGSDIENLKLYIKDIFIEFELEWNDEFKLNISDKQIDLSSDKDNKTIYLYI
jgi:hypothetical protein